MPRNRRQREHARSTKGLPVTVKGTSVPVGKILDAPLASLGRFDPVRQVARQAKKGSKRSFPADYL